VNGVVNYIATKPQFSRYVAKPEIVSIFQSDLGKLKPAFDTFERCSRRMTNALVRAFFPNNEIDGGNFRKEMYLVKTSLFVKGLFSKDAFKKWEYSVDLSNPLRNLDYREITNFMNLHEGKFINLWKDEKDNMRNIEKLALFIRSLIHIEKTEQGKVRNTNKLDYFKNLPEEEWAVCLDGIINRPSYVIEPLMQYKYTSVKINNAISYHNGSKLINSYIEAIEKFLDTQSLKTDMKTFRGEGNFNLFEKVKLANGNTLKEALEEATEKIENGSWKQSDIDEFIDKYLFRQKITQERFMSTAMIPEDTEKYAKKVMWYLDLPKGTKCSFVEAYNVDRESESEILVQRGAELFINNMEYDFENHRWNIGATVEQ